MAGERAEAGSQRPEIRDRKSEVEGKKARGIRIKD
jgi:hypothetical protein